MSELTNDEILELKVVMQEMEDLLSAIPEFNPDRFNYLQLGNNLNQLHFHCFQI